MLSDVGINSAIIQSDRGDDRRFLNTAWTLQILRGFFLYFIAAACAYPLARFYNEPDLFLLTMVGSITVCINGFQSTALFSLRRHLNTLRINLIELGSQVAGLCIMIPWAMLYPSPWALVAGAIGSSICKMIASHLLDVGYRNRLEWDRDASRSIIHFGKWIAASSAVAFISTQGDRLFLGRFIGVTELGIYSVAIILSEAVSVVLTRVTHGVLYPLFSRIRRESEQQFPSVYYRSRLALDGFSLPLLGIMVVMAHTVIDVLYDNRYIEAGWMLSAFCFRVAMMSVLIPSETCLFSLGLTRYNLYQALARAFWILIAVPIGWKLYGITGLVWAVALSEVPIFFVLWPALRRVGVLRISREMLAIPFFSVGLGIGWLVKHLFAL